MARLARQGHRSCNSPASIISPPSPATRRATTPSTPQTLGMRLVKKTVNQDDVSAYHLFYADGRGSPGTDITFFDWPVGREQRGTHSITRTGLRVAGADTLAWWKQRFQDDGRHALRDRRARRAADARLRGFRGPAPQPGRRRRRRASVPSVGAQPGAGRAPDPRPRPDHHQRARSEADRTRADAGHEHEPASGTTPRPATRRLAHPRLPDGRGRSGGRAARRRRARPAGGPARGGRRPSRRLPHPRRRLRGLGGAAATRCACRRAARSTASSSAASISASRTASCSRSPPTGPGFATDEPMDTLGEKLSLPPFLEGRRRQIEADLKPL